VSQTPRRPYSRTGLNALKARVKLRGLAAIDMRTSAARALLAWRQELTDDLGGDGALSTQERTLVDLAAKAKLLLDSVDAWILEQPTLISAKHRSVLPVVLQRQQLADALARYLTALGLKRRARKVHDLNSYLAQQYGPSAPPGEAGVGS